jgi:hypothetical protein
LNKNESDDTDTGRGFSQRLLTGVPVGSLPRFLGRVSCGRFLGHCGQKMG